jgi:hypothetical protein
MGYGDASTGVSVQNKKGISMLGLSVKKMTSKETEHKDEAATSGETAVDNPGNCSVEIC